jgi:hypothetical protein
MQRTVLNCATIEMANNRYMSGRATADEINRVLRTGKQRSIWRIASLILPGSWMVAGLLVAVAPLPTRAENDEDSRHGHEDNDRGIRAEIKTLQATVSTLQEQVNKLQTANTRLQNEINSLQTSNTTLHSQLAAVRSNHALLLGPFVSVDPNPEIGVIGPNIIFSGANIHIVSGSGRTDDNGNRTGLGNLIIGYDEDPGMAPVPAFPPLRPGDRGGSHNLVIGRWHRFTLAAFGGFVAGEANFITNEGASVSGGFTNTASGDLASVTGGQDNTASGFQASVTGGQANAASGQFASVSGGVSNTARGFLCSAVSGGSGNTASGSNASVSGGHLNISSADGSSVLGGIGNTAGGMDTVVIGGHNVTNNKDNSIAPQPPFP